MSDDLIKINGFNSINKTLQENNIETTEEELASLFASSLEENKNSIDSSVFLQAVNDKYSLNEMQKTAVLNELNELSLLDGVEENLSIDDINAQAEIYMNQISDENFVSLLDDGTKDALVSVLENIVLTQEQSLNTAKENNGIIAKGWDWFKNKTGLGQGSDKVQNEITDLKQQVASLKNNPDKLQEVYKTVTGNDLTLEEFQKLCTGETDFSNSKVINSVSKYQQGQKQVVNTISTVGSAITVVGLVTAGVVAAPFTGGASLGASFAALGTLTAAGTAAYMLPQAIDGFSEKDGYSAKEAAQDIASGVINSALTATGIGVGKSLGAGLAAKATTQAGKTAAALAAGEATSVIMGDGMAAGEYLSEVAFNDDVQFSAKDFGKTMASATAASLAAGATAFGTTSALRPILTSGSTAQSQVVGRLLTSGISGGAAGASASAAAGSTDYLINCAIEGKDVDFAQWVDAATQNIATGTMTGVIAGVTFEASQIVQGTAKPQNAVKTEKGVTQDGIKYTNYLDKDGNVIATDFKASDLSKQLGNAQDISMDKNARTIRLSYDVKNTTVVDGERVYDAKVSSLEVQQHDWADNTKVLAQRTSITQNGVIAPEAPVESKLIEEKPQQQKPKQEITPEVEKQLKELAKSLSDEYNQNIASVEKEMTEEYGKLGDSEKLTARAKSEKSVLAKLKSKYESGDLQLSDDATLNMAAAREKIGDGYGSRLQMKSLNQTDALSTIQKACGDNITLEDFTKVLSDFELGKIDIRTYEGGKYFDALNALKEAQNAQTFNKLLDDISNNNIKITEINNYGNEISSYFTDNQILKLADAYYEATGKPLKIITKDNVTMSTNLTSEQLQMLVDNPDNNFLNKLQFDTAENTKAIKKSGYTSCQMNVEYDLDGLTGYGEFQIRGDKVNTFADVEHIPYDIRKGKITADDARYSDVYSTLKNMSKESYDVYNKYLTETYDYLRLQELGIDVPEPKLATNLTYEGGGAIPIENIQTITQEGLIKVAAKAH